MEISSRYLADLLIGIAKAQTAVIDAMDRASPGFRNTHAVPLLQIASNMRAGDPRLIDLPSRVLLRMQGRVALDSAAVMADLERLATGTPSAPGGASAASATASPASAAVAQRPAPAAPDSGGSDLDFRIKP